MVKKPEKVGGQKVATGRLCRGRGAHPPAAGSKGVWGRAPATENFCIFYLKKQFLVRLTV